jgi:hypothetical protein
LSGRSTEELRRLLGDTSASYDGAFGRGTVARLVQDGDLRSALAVARGIRHPWFRCQAISSVAAALPARIDRGRLVLEALRAADELGEPNRIVTVASWPIRILVDDGPRDTLQGEIDRLLAIAATEPHTLRRADGLSTLLHFSWDDPGTRNRILEAFVDTCAGAHGWRRDRLIANVATRLLEVDRGRAEGLAAMIETPRTARRLARLLGLGQEPEVPSEDHSAPG